MRVGNGRAREFRWNQARHVQDWLDEEGWTEWHDGALRFGRVSSVASLCQQVWAATNGATIRSEPGKTSSYSGKQAAVMLDAIWERDGKPLPKKTVTVRIDGKGQIRGLYGK